MKRISSIFVMIFVLCSFVKVGFCGLFDNLTASTFFNLKDPVSICYGGTTSLLNYKEIVSLDLGIITDAQKLAYGAGIGINLGTLIKKFPGWDINDVFKQGKLGGFVAKYQWNDRTIDMVGIYIGTYISFGQK